MNNRTIKLLVVLFAAVVLCGCIGAVGLMFAPIWDCHTGMLGDYHCHTRFTPEHVH
jgi:hypothetical protein